MSPQLTTELDGSTVLISSTREVEDGARCSLVHVPGVFRLDVAPMQDTLRLVVRTLGRNPCRWTSETAGVVLSDEAALALRPAGYTVGVDAGDRRAEILIGLTFGRHDALVRFTAQARVTRS